MQPNNHIYPPVPSQSEYAAQYAAEPAPAPPAHTSVGPIPEPQKPQATIQDYNYTGPQQAPASHAQQNQAGGYPPPGYPPAPGQPTVGSGPQVWGFPAQLPEDEAAGLSAADLRREQGATLCASLMLLFGFCFPVFWFIGALAPCISPRSRRVRWLACLNGTIFAIGAIIIVLLCAFFANTNSSRV